MTAEQPGRKAVKTKVSEENKNTANEQEESRRKTFRKQKL